MSISKENIIEAYWFRHACKEFDAKQKISDADFQFILETARLSPCSFGLEPWRFLIIQNPDLREKLKPLVWGGQKHLPTASHLILALLRKSHFMRFDSEFVQHFMRQVQAIPEPAAEFRTEILEKFQSQDFDLLSSERAINDWAGKQTYLPLANMMTAAALIGIDSCPIEGFDRSALEQFLQDNLDINPDYWSVSYLLTFGYRKEQPTKEKTRQALTDIVEWIN